MHIVGVLGRDPNLLGAIHRFRDPHGRFHLHPLQEGPVEGVLAGLQPLEFAGLLILDPESETAAASSVQRHSLDAQEARAVDAVSLAGGGLIGEYNAGRALAALLTAGHWDGRGARAVLLGSGNRVAAMARELASMGASQVTILAESRPAAEQSIARLAASTKVVASAVGDPRSDTLLAEADLLVRLEPGPLELPAHALGPHLCLVDLASPGLSELRRDALDVGALTFGATEYQAHRIALGLSHILGAEMPTQPLLALLDDTQAP